MEVMGWRDGGDGGDDVNVVVDGGGGGEEVGAAWGPESGERE
jgi:hypothetical protein